MRPAFNEIVSLLLGEISLEIKTNDEPIFGSGKVIGESNQKDMSLGDDGGISKEMHDSVVRELDIERAEKKKLADELCSERAEKKKLNEELHVLRTTARGGGGRGDGGVGVGSIGKEKYEAEDVETAKKIKKDKEAEEELAAMMAMMGR